MYYRPKRNRIHAAALCTALFTVAAFAVVFPYIRNFPKVPCFAVLSLCLASVIILTDRYMLCDIFYTVDDGYFCAARAGRGIVFRRSVSLITGILSPEEWKAAAKEYLNDGFRTEKINLCPDFLPGERTVVVFSFDNNITAAFLQGGDEIEKSLAPLCPSLFDNNK